MNLVILTGRLGKNPEVRRLENGKTVASFSLATRAGKDKADWHNISLWDKAAEIAEKYVKKGDQITVEGSLKTRSWDKDGVTKYITEVVAYKIHLLGGGKSQEAETVEAEEVDENGLPF